MISLRVDLTDDQLEQLAVVVAEKLRATPAPERKLVDAQTIAAALGISRDTVYDNAAQLGGVKIGDGPRPRWRFDLETALEAWKPAGEPVRVAPRHRRPRKDLLPVRGEQ